MAQENKKVRIKYYEDNMSKMQHLLAYLGFALAIGVILFIYYRWLPICIVGGLLIAIPQEKNYSKSVRRKRQSRLRLQFNEFLEIITISISGGHGRSMENAVKDSLRELNMMFNADTDIVREIALIVSDYEKAGIPMKDGFMELGKRSEIDDIISFATIEGKTSDFGYIIAQTHDIIRDKVEITMEIETSISSAKSEAYMMLVLPLVLIVVMTAMGSGLMDSLFTTLTGRLAATFGVICTFASYVIAVRATEIEV